MEEPFMQRGVRRLIGLTGLGLCLLLVGSATAQEPPIFEKPVRLMADGKVIDTGEAWGHCGPCIADVDGDGTPDLLVGDFSGFFHFYKNVGTKDKPEYVSKGRLKAGGVDAHVHIY
jgi:hypothetical protein